MVMDTLFLVLSLFFPRIALLFYYIGGSIPSNPVPFWADAAMAVLIPRVLIIVYIASNLGISSGWFWLHLIVAILAYCSGGSYQRSRSK
jgi:hypothetical protein